MANARTPSLLAIVATAGFALAAQAQDSGAFKDPYSLRMSNPRGYLGLNVGHVRNREP